MKTLATAFWMSFFALYWLMLLDLVELQMKTSVALAFFFVFGALLSVQIAGREMMVAKAKAASRRQERPRKVGHNGDDDD